MCLGVPGQIVALVDPETQQAMAEVEGVRREISVALLGMRLEDGTVRAIGETDGTAAVGLNDWVLIHVGFAMSRIDEKEAQETMKALKLFTGDFTDEMLEFASGDGGIDPLAFLRPDTSG